MQDRKIVLYGIWSIIAITAIVILVLLVINKTSMAGAFSASDVLGSGLSPEEICSANGCNYIGHIFPQPTFGPGRVDCDCAGEIKTFQLLESDIDDLYSYYP